MSLYSDQPTTPYLCVLGVLPTVHCLTTCHPGNCKTYLLSLTYSRDRNVLLYIIKEPVCAQRTRRGMVFFFGINGMHSQALASPAECFLYGFLKPPWSRYISKDFSGRFLRYYSRTSRSSSIRLYKLICIEGIPGVCSLRRGEVLVTGLDWTILQVTTYPFLRPRSRNDHHSMAVRSESARSAAFKSRCSGLVLHMALFRRAYSEAVCGRRRT
ncbi:hypothetical protein BKA82DRAFT_764692 [Pisolithus tinctorius]|uniref:Uncharacterized protein n=1 Tax=Pisolithus tinctorius Marx 270 TaxID=870435 RepID=A0A0C3NYW8_PISTI|nr:hypothetical protein BKA82DRAFT_764692 [Pisolithus tinctorius]KIO00476.1 hypothetical protein M404DRAFT_764692 [Pisolithus tinctorius Marx 270]